MDVHAAAGALVLGWRRGAQTGGLRRRGLIGLLLHLQLRLRQKRKHTQLQLQPPIQRLLLSTNATALDLLITILSRGEKKESYLKKENSNNIFFNILLSKEIRLF